MALLAEAQVFTGSATVLNDAAHTPVLSYSVATNDMQCLAMPANRSDPDLIVWTKYSGNPVISVKTGALPGRDPTTAWWSDSLQKWRMTYGTTEGANVYELIRRGSGSARISFPFPALQRRFYSRPAQTARTTGRRGCTTRLRAVSHPSLVPFPVAANCMTSARTMQGRRKSHGQVAPASAPAHSY